MEGMEWNFLLSKRVNVKIVLIVDAIAVFQNMKESEKQLWTKRANNKKHGHGQLNERKPNGSAFVYGGTNQTRVPRVYHREESALSIELTAFLQQNLSNIGTVTFPFVHFSQYCVTGDGYGIPAEYAVCTFSLKDGLIKSVGSLIDPGIVKDSANIR